MDIWTFGQLVSKPKILNKSKNLHFLGGISYRLGLRLWLINAVNARNLFNITEKMDFLLIIPN